DRRRGSKTFCPVNGRKNHGGGRFPNLSGASQVVGALKASRKLQQGTVETVQPTGKGVIFYRLFSFDLHVVFVVQETQLFQQVTCIVSAFIRKTPYRPLLNEIIFIDGGIGVVRRHVDITVIGWVRKHVEGHNL